jgi:hypothetical protein
MPSGAFRESLSEDPARVASPPRVDESTRIEKTGVQVVPGSQPGNDQNWVPAQRKGPAAPSSAVKSRSNTRIQSRRWLTPSSQPVPSRHALDHSTMAVLSVVSWIVVRGCSPRRSSPETPVLGFGKPRWPDEPPPHRPRRVLAGPNAVLRGGQPGLAGISSPDVDRHARRFQLDPLLVLAVIRQSRFDRPPSRSRVRWVSCSQGPTARDLATELGSSGPATTSCSIPRSTCCSAARTFADC